MWKTQDEMIYHVTKKASNIDKSEEDITCTLRIGGRICTTIPDGGFDFKACKCFVVNFTSNFYYKSQPRLTWNSPEQKAAKTPKHLQIPIKYMHPKNHK